MCRVSSSVEWSLPKPQRRVRFPYPAPSSPRTGRSAAFSYKKYPTGPFRVRPDQPLPLGEAAARSADGEDKRTGESPSQSPAAPAPPEGEPRAAIAAAQKRRTRKNLATAPKHCTSRQESVPRGVQRGHGFGARERDAQCPLWLLLSGISCQHKKYPRRRHPAATISSCVRT